MLVQKVNFLLKPTWMCSKNDIATNQFMKTLKTLYFFTLSFKTLS